MKKISCIIPAYNEGKTIEGTLSAAVPLIGTYLHEIIVVDDGSHDDTKQILNKFPQVTLISHETNKGKSKSVADGIQASAGEYIFLLDADLKFLKEQNIIDLIQPIESAAADVVLEYLKNSWPLFPFKTIDYLAGERILPRALLMDNIDAMDTLPSYGLEVFINKIIIKNKLRIRVVRWPNVENTFSQDKRGWWRGWKVVIKIWWNVLCTVSIFEMYYQNIQMLRLLVKE